MLYILCKFGEIIELPPLQGRSLDWVCVQSLLIWVGKRNHSGKDQVGNVKGPGAHYEGKHPHPLQNHFSAL